MTQNNKPTQKRIFRKLEDLNLIDNFLFQAVLSDEKEGEKFARILLSTILGKPIRKVRIVPQKNVLGLDTDKHGIRMDAYIENISAELDYDSADLALDADVYDIEPNICYEKKSLPKRLRYYNGLADTQLLSTGVHYDQLPNIVIIVILPYDPFDKNRMIYTVRNQCEEAPSIPYDDGAKKIFLYTRGTEGNPSQGLKDMLKYIEKSTEDNVTNQDIASIQELVNKVKHKREVGINYMKSWEMEELARKQGFDDGFSDGINQMQDKMNQLTLLLSEAGRTEDIIKSARDKAYQEELFKEFHL